MNVNLGWVAFHIIRILFIVLSAIFAGSVLNSYFAGTL